MRKLALVIIVLAAFTLSGCKFLPFGAKPNPSQEPVQETEDQSPSQKPTPSDEDEDEDNSPSADLSINQTVGQTSVPKPSGTDDTVDFYLQGGEADTYYSSTDDYAFYDDVIVDIDLDGDGKDDTISVDFFTEYEQSDEYNNPVGITLTVGSQSVSYENLWNDGVYVAFADFDASDPYLDIYILSYGTDVSASVSTYIYDGASLYNYLGFDIAEDTMFYYDTVGYLYYVGAYDQNYGVSLYIDYKTGDIYTIE